MGSLRDICGFACRRLARQPGLTAVLVAVPAVGLAFATAMTSLVDSLVLRPLPFPESHRLVSVQTTNELAPALLEDWRDRGAFDVVEEYSAPVDTRIVVRGTSAPARMRFVSAGLLPALGARPLAGRLLDGAATLHAYDRVVISERLWRAVFNADQALLEHAVMVGDRQMAVAGVLPQTFRFPDQHTELWGLLDDRQSTRMVGFVIARIRQGVPEADAAAVTAALTATRHPDEAAGGFRPSLRPLLPPLADATRAALVLVWIAIVGLFFAACANLAGLVLAALLGRRTELAVCTALGASRIRLLAPILVEHVLLGTATLGFGLGLAWIVLRVAAAFLPDAMMTVSLNPVDLDRRAVAAAASLVAAATLLTGILPASSGTSVDVTESLQRESRSRPATQRISRLAQFLLGAQVAFSFAVLLVAISLARSFVELARTDPGIDATNIVAGSIVLSRSATTPEEFRSAAIAIEERLQALPAVDAVAMSMQYPGRKRRVLPREVTSDAPGAQPALLALDHYQVTPAFFRLYDIRAARGRLLISSDGSDEVVIGERLAQILWPNDSPLGRSFEVSSARYHVVGVASELTVPSIDRELDRPEFYSAFRPQEAFFFQLRCRTSCPPLETFRDRIRDAYPVSRVEAVRLEDEFAAELTEPRRAAMAGLMAAGLSLITAAAGLFSLLTFASHQRKREFGVRAALGASSASLRATVLGHAVRIVVTGLLAGGVLGWIAMRSLSTLHYRVGPSDPWTWFCACAVVSAIVAIASWAPARSAARTDPATLLRAM